MLSGPKSKKRSGYKYTLLTFVACSVDAVVELLRLGCFAVEESTELPGDLARAIPA